MERKLSRGSPGFCEDCKAPCGGGFKKVFSLQNSGLVIYRHNNKNSPVQNKVTDVYRDENYILHNTSYKNLRKPDFINELCQFKTECFKCKTAVQKVRSLIDEISDIRGNEIMGVCKHCRKANPAGNCRKCEYIVNKYLKNKVMQYEDRQSRFKTWLCKVKMFLQALLENERVCRHKMYQVSSTTELERLLRELKSPLSMRELDIEFFPSMEAEKLKSLESISQSKDMLEELITKLKCENCRRYASDDSLYVSPSKTTTGCVCKYFMDKKFEGKLSMELLTTVTTEKETANMVKQSSKGSTKIAASNDKPINKNLCKGIKETQKERSPLEGKTRKGKTPSAENKSKVKSGKLEKPIKEDSPKKAILTSEEQLLVKMIKERKNMKLDKEKTVKQDKVKQLPKFEELPTLKVIEKVEIYEEKSESVIECSDQKPLQPKDMIQGNNIVNVDRRYQYSDTNEVKPLLYKVQAACPEPVVAQDPSLNEVNKTPNDKFKGAKYDRQDSEDLMNGVINYRLSDREFVDKGWTKLPTTKIMRMMSVYKMKPANPKNDWFKRHKYTKIMFYDSGEKLAEIDDDGYGRWYYKNGIVALDYYNAKDSNVGQRYVIYSSGAEIENGNTKPITVLASFDHLGNGVVYDHYGNERLKYNQSEGMVIDEKVAPPGRWMWHTLNEPPVLQQVFIDTHVKSRSPCIDSILKNHKTDSHHRISRDAEILAIELNNFAKARAKKLLQKFKPFEIRMKAMKLNEHFSLRILDQANIYLLFRNGPVSLKLNLGMVLISNEIVDTEVAEVFQVATPYDKNPPKSESVEDIQGILKQAQEIGKKRGFIRVAQASSRISKCSS